MQGDKIGFIGLGEMGKPMASNLLRKEFDITVCDVRPQVVEELTGLGAKAAGSAKEIGMLSDIVIVMVRDSGQAESVILGKDGVLEGIRGGSLILVMSTVTPHLCQRAAEIAAEKKVGLLDAPVSGGARGAEAATLSIMVGGEEALLNRCRHVLEAMGNNIFHVGAVGMGQVVKLANNSAFFSSAVGMAESVALATKAGVPLERLLDIMRVSSAESGTQQRWLFWQTMKKQQGLEEIMFKDLTLALDAAKNQGLHLPLLEFMVQMDIPEDMKEG